MQQNKKTKKSQCFIFPDTVSDSNSARIYLSIVIFSSFTLLFNQVTINKEADKFIQKYKINNVTQIPEKFLPFIDDLNLFGVKQDSTLSIYNTLMYEQQNKIKSLEDILQLQEEYQDYQFELGVINVLLTYLLIDIISVLTQYIFSSLATIQYFNNQYSLFANLLISASILGIQLWFTIYYEIHFIYMISVRLMILFIIFVYSLLLMIGYYQRKSFFLFFGNFHDDFKMICYEYTFQRLYNDYSRNWNNFVGRRIRKINIQNYIQEQVYVQNDRQKIKQNNYLEFSHFQILKNIFEPFCFAKRRYIIGDFVYYPMKFISALLISLFVYFYLIFWWIKVANQLKQISDNTKDILRVIVEKFSKDSLKVILTIINAIYNSFIVTIAIETFAIVFYTIFLIHTFKKEIIKLRKGKKKWNQSVSSFDSVKFLPYYTGNVLIALFVLTTFCIFIFTILLLPYFWIAIFRFMLMNKSLLIAFIFNTAIIYVAKYFTMEKEVVKRRRLLIFVEFMYFFTGIASTLLKGGIRVVWAFFGNLFNIFRVDKPIVSGQIYALDEAYNVFAGLILMYHQQNNPIVLTFVDLLKNRDKNYINSQEQNFFINKKYNKKQIRRKFFLCVFLARNPNLCQYRKKEKNDHRVCTTYLDFIIAELDPKIPEVNLKYTFQEEKRLKVPLIYNNVQKIQKKNFKIDIENTPKIPTIYPQEYELNEQENIQIYEDSIIKIPSKM